MLRCHAQDTVHTAISFSQICHSHAPNAVVSHNNLLSRLDTVGYTGLHASMACAADEQCVAQVCLKYILQALLNFIHDFEERGVHVTQHGK